MWEELGLEILSLTNICMNSPNCYNSCLGLRCIYQQESAFNHDVCPPAYILYTHNVCVYILYIYIIDNTDMHENLVCGPHLDLLVGYFFFFTLDTFFT